MIFNLLIISWFITICAFILAFISEIQREDSYYLADLPARYTWRKWLFVGLIILSTLMMGLMIYLNWRIGKIADGLMIERPYPIHVQSLPALPAVLHPTKPIIQINRTKASYYDYSLHGDPDYSKKNLVAASNVYPRGSMVEVCADTCVIVRINDYGPDPKVFPDRQIDLSSFAFKKLSPISRGVIEVKMRQIK